MLVFSILEWAEQFYLSIGKNMPLFVPVKVPVEELLELAVQYKAICVAEGLTVRVGSICNTAR